ncbi:hypothetical protein SAMN05444008_12536 [Cnuella takakiae]|uniref:Uncharacterized protein n=1 Tax=Cnuella takakiae TaxID=1302690 RepID=A0A1M5IS26_9BACT|nr:hypothetical protein [Cnuella takakiae]OLY93972.1 hypothetical protein BUE76_20365 [Cnuella takakiae]SHG31148.1 hypothetical protein SAMN05444008_12536 [Cnuella takakiae]
MKIADVLESGITGVTTLSLIQEALGKMNGDEPHTMLHKSDTIKQLQKGKKSGKKSKELYVNLAGELLGHAGLFGLSGLGKKKNAILRGGLLGAAAGLAIAFLDNDNDTSKQAIHADGRMYDAEAEAMRQKIVTVTLYTLGGVLAGAAIKAMNNKKIKKTKVVKGLKKAERKLKAGK